MTKYNLFNNYIQSLLRDSSNFLQIILCTMVRDYTKIRMISLKCSCCMQLVGQGMGDRSNTKCGV